MQDRYRQYAGLQNKVSTVTEVGGTVVNKANANERRARGSDGHEWKR